MLAGALADSDVFQVGYPLALLVVSTAISAVLAAWRARNAPHPPQGTMLSVTQVVQIHHHHYGGRGSARRTRERVGSWMDGREPAEIAVAVLAVLFGVAVAIWLVARGFAEARDELVFALKTVAALNFGTALGAYLALRRYTWFDSSWRWPVAACALIALIGGVDVYLLLHPTLATGEYDAVFESVLREGSPVKGAVSDVDANVFLAIQGIASLLSLALLATSLVLVVGVRAAIEESVGLRLGFLRRAARKRVGFVDKRSVSVVLVLLAVLSATLCAGWGYNLLKSLLGKADRDAPTVSSLSARAGIKKLSVGMVVYEPVRVTVTVTRPDGRRGGRSTVELRPSAPRLLVYGRADRKRLRGGRYTVSVVIRDEAGNATRRIRYVRIR